MLTGDLTVHWPPSTQAAPDPGYTYQDATFLNGGPEVIRLIRNQVGENLYNRNGYWSRNGTYIYSYNNSTMHNCIRSATTGVSLGDIYPTIQSSDGSSFDPIDDTKFYGFTGANLVQLNLPGFTSTVVRTFPGTCDQRKLGDQCDFISADGDIWLVEYSSEIHVWKKSTDTIYTGTIPSGYVGNGFATVTADGQWLVLNGDGGGLNGNTSYAYAINHVTHTLNTSPIKFLDVFGGGHADVSSTSDGKNYFYVHDNWGWNALFAFDISVSRDGWDRDAQRASGLKLTPDVGFNTAWHVGRVSIGSLKDWAVVVSYPGSETLHSPAVLYDAEVFMINVLTGAVRRYCHTRQNLIVPSYKYGLMSVHWTGDKVAFTTTGAMFTNSVSGVYALELNGGTPPTGSIVLTVS